jgi:hypothetical protein
LIKITVTTEEEKQELLVASKHVQDLRDLNTDIPGANLIAHLYLAPHLIEVDPTFLTPPQSLSAPDAVGKAEIRYYHLYTTTRRLRQSINTKNLDNMHYVVHARGATVLHLEIRQYDLDTEQDILVDKHVYSLSQLVELENGYLQKTIAGLKSFHEFEELKNSL